MSEPLAPTRDDDRPGLLSLEGFVVDEQDRPVPRARVCLDTQPPRQLDTDGQGYFSFNGLVGRAYELAAILEDASIGPLKVNVAPESAPVLLRLRRASILEVHVVDAVDGRRLAGAQVDLLGVAGLSSTCDGQGVARLRGVGAGRYVVRASADRHAPVRREIFPSGRPGGLTEVTLRLQAGAEVSGTVVDPSGAPVAGAAVELERASAALFLASDAEGARTDRSGQFRFAAVAAGGYRLRATHSDFAPAVSPPFEADGATPQTRHLLRLGQGGRISGRVVMRSGAPAPFAAIQAVFDKAPSLKPSRRLFCDEKGLFTLGGLPRVSIALGADDASATSHFTLVNLAASAEVQDVVLTLEQDGAIGGIVVGSDGTPRAEVVVRLADEQAILQMPLPSPADLTGADGHFLLRGLTAGKHRVQAVAPGSPFSQLRVSKDMAGQAEAETGKLDLQLVLDEGAVHGRVRFEDGRVPTQFTLHLEQDQSDRVTFGAGDGSFKLERVPAGLFVLTVSGREFQERKVDLQVPASGDLDVGILTLERGRTLRGVVQSAAGAPVAGARVIAARSLGSDLDLALGASESYDEGQEALSDASGAFALEGLSSEIRVVAADHPTEGASAHLTAPKGDAPISLTLRAQASISGTLTRGGKPVQGAVTAQHDNSHQATVARWFVTSEADGSYRFDHLPMGHYTIGYSGAYRLDLLTVTMEDDERKVEVELAAGEARRLDLEIPARPTLNVQAFAAGRPVEGTMFLGGPELTASRFEALLSTPAVRQSNTGSWVALRSELPPLTVVFAAVEPGAYALCFRPFEPQTEAVRCQPVRVEPSPDVQSLRLEVK